MEAEKKKPIVAVLLEMEGVGPELVVKLVDKGVLASCGKPLSLKCKIRKSNSEFTPGLKWQQVEKAEADWFKESQCFLARDRAGSLYHRAGNEIAAKSRIEMIQCAVELYKKAW